MSQKPHGPVSERFMRDYYGASKAAPSRVHEMATALAAPSECPRCVDAVELKAIRLLLNKLVLAATGKGYQMDREPPLPAEDRITDADVDRIEQQIVTRLEQALAAKEAALVQLGVVAEGEASEK